MSKPNKGQVLLRYPITRQTDDVDMCHDTPVPDPYRWLEDIGSPETVEWTDAQVQTTRDYFSSVGGCDAVRDRLCELWDYEKWGIPSLHGDLCLVSRNNGLQNHPVLYAMTSDDGADRVLLDPNTWSVDGRKALASVSPSRDGSFLAYGVSTSGSDWQELRVLEVETGTTLTDRVTGVKFSGASWIADARGFFYTRYREPALQATPVVTLTRGAKICYHRLGTPEEQDVLIYSCPEHPEWLLHSTVTDDGRYLVITASSGTTSGNAIMYKDLSCDDSPVVTLLPPSGASYGFVANSGPVLWFRTDLGACRWRVIGIDITQADQSRWNEVIPESRHIMQRVTFVGGRFFVRYLADAYNRVHVFSEQGIFERELALPGIGTVTGFAGTATDTQTFYAFTSFTHPVSIFRYDIPTATATLFWEPRLKFDPNNFETRQVFFRSKDNTRVPMFLSFRNGLPLTHDTPVHLYGYGGFRNSLTPSFSVGNLVWMEMGGVHAVVNVRGGGEYGQAWHAAGTRRRKQNSFDDFIAAAEWLIDNGYTSPGKLAASGGSNGGLLVAACMVQRPDLFCAVQIVQGVLDMLRFHKFTIGWAWVREYGSPDDPDDFTVLRGYSPLHNISSGACYPATLIRTADHDDRVWPGASLKFTAALQRAQGCSAPILLDMDRNQGHGNGTPTGALIERYARALTFFSHELGMTPETALSAVVSVRASQ